MSLVQEIRQLFESTTGRGILGVGPVTSLESDWLAAAGARIDLFTITGEIFVRCIYCVCTAAPAGAAQPIEFDCTAGSALCPLDDGIGDLNGIGVGDIIAPQGDITLPCVVAGPLNGGPIMVAPFIMSTGSVGVTITNAQDHGEWDCYMYYLPLTVGATVVAT